MPNRKFFFELFIPAYFYRFNIQNRFMRILLIVILIYVMLLANNIKEDNNHEEMTHQ